MRKVPKRVGSIADARPVTLLAPVAHAMPGGGEVGKRRPRAFACAVAALGLLALLDLHGLAEFQQMQVLAERIHDGRFLALVDGMLKAGYLEDFIWHATYSGAPQGSGLTPPTQWATSASRCR